MLFRSPIRRRRRRRIPEPRHPAITPSTRRRRRHTPSGKDPYGQESQTAPASTARRSPAAAQAAPGETAKSPPQAAWPERRASSLAGATTIPVKVFANDTIPTTENKIPMIIGDLKEGIKFFDRKKLNITTSNVAVVGTGESAINAYEEDLNLFRAIEREDCQTRDDKAFVNGYISTTTQTEPSA